MRRAARLSLLLILSVSLTGCIFSREMASLQRDIQDQNPDLRLRRNFVLSVGSGSIHTLESIVSLLDDEDAQRAAAYLHDVDRIRLGIYDVEWKDDPRPLDVEGVNRFRAERWERALVIREDDTVAHLLYRPRRNSIRDLYLLAMTDDQLIAIRFQGNLERILTHALQDRHRFLRASLRPIAGSAEVRP